MCRSLGLTPLSHGSANNVKGAPPTMVSHGSGGSQGSNTGSNNGSNNQGNNQGNSSYNQNSKQNGKNNGKSMSMQEEAAEESVHWGIDQAFLRTLDQFLERVSVALRAQDRYVGVLGYVSMLGCADVCIGFQVSLVLILLYYFEPDRQN